MLQILIQKAIEFFLISFHHRGKNDSEDNLLIVEVKIKWGPRTIDHDLKKLSAFTGRSEVGQLVSYRFGLFLMFDESGEVIYEKQFKRPKK